MRGRVRAIVRVRVGVRARVSEADVHPLEVDDVDVLAVALPGGVALRRDLEASLVPVDALRPPLLRREALLPRGPYRAEPCHRAIDENGQPGARLPVLPRLALRTVHQVRRQSVLEVGLRPATVILPAPRLRLT